MPLNFSRPLPLNFSDHTIWNYTMSTSPIEYSPKGIRDLYSMVYHKFYGSPLALVACLTHSNALEACSYLLEKGFCADELTWLVAASSNNTTFVQTLVDHRQRGNYTYQHFNSQNPLKYAIRYGNKEMITLLLTAGVDVNGHGLWVGEPLLAAVDTGDPNIVNHLIRAGANVNPNHLLHCRSSLQRAVEIGQLDIVDCLIQAGADVNSPPAKRHGATTLQLAAINGDLGLAKYLIDEGAQVNAPPSPRYGRTALQGAAEHGRIEMLEFLLTEGALTTGRWRRRFIKAVKLALEEEHFTAADILKRSAGWSEEDENLLPSVDPDYDTESEADELNDVATNDAMNSSDGKCDDDSDVQCEMNMDREEEVVEVVVQEEWERWINWSLVDDRQELGA